MGPWLHYWVVYTNRRERLGCPRQAAHRCIGRPHLLQLGQLLPLNLPTAPTTQTPRSNAFALVHSLPSSHLSLSTASTSIMALLKLSTLALLALRAAAVFAAEVDVSQLFLCVARDPGIVASQPTLCSALLCSAWHQFCNFFPCVPRV